MYAQPIFPFRVLYLNPRIDAIVNVYSGSNAVKTFWS
jgi:hypothetical protein